MTLFFSGIVPRNTGKKLPSASLMPIIAQRVQGQGECVNEEAHGRKVRITALRKF
jgi:hypothetical protein